VTNLLYQLLSPLTTKRTFEVVTAATFELHGIDGGVNNDSNYYRARYYQFITVEV